MKEQTIYLVFLGGGLYEDSWDELLITFDNEEEANKYLDEYVLPEIPKALKLFEKFQDDIFDDLYYGNVPEDFNLEAEFLKSYPEFTPEDLEKPDDSIYRRDATVISIQKLVTGEHASLQQTKWRYL